MTPNVTSDMSLIFVCKFKESCNYSHEEGQEQKEIALIREEIEKIKNENEALEAEMKMIHTSNENLEHCILCSA